MIIECFGLPGAGKTTVAKLFAGEKEVIMVPEYVSKWTGVFFAVRNISFVLQISLTLFREGMKAGGWQLARYKVAIFYHTLCRYAWAVKCDGPSQFLVLDEGLIQRLLGLYESFQADRVYQRILKRLPSKGVVVEIMYDGKKFPDPKVSELRRSFGDLYQREWGDVLAANYQKISGNLHLTKYRIVQYRRDEEDREIDTLFHYIKTLQL